MKATFESVYNLPETSFTVRRFEERCFSAPYHYHPELELTFIVNGSGKRYIGGRIDDYHAGDLVLLGENLPHCWKTDDGNVQKGIPSKSIVVHFKRDFLGEDFFAIAEMTRIGGLLNQSRNGLYFSGNTAIEVGEMLESLLFQSNSVSRIGQLLNILDKLSFSEESIVLEQHNLYDNIPIVEREKINNITAYLLDHFKEPLCIEQAAQLVHLSPSAFCRYFKKITRRTFIETVVDYRIDYAARHLRNTDMPIAHIAFDSGFADMSNFYRAFKKRKNLSPLTYRKIFLK